MKKNARKIPGRRVEKPCLHNRDNAIIEDAITAGILGAMPGCTVTPRVDSQTHRVVFHISGDINRLMASLYENAPVGSLDAVRSIKSARSAIFQLKELK